MASDWITVEDAAKQSGYGEDYIRKLASQKKIKAQKFATVWQVSRTSLIAYLREMQKEGEKRGRKKGVDSSTE